MPRNTHFQDYWLTDRSFKLWVRKSGEKTAFCSCCRKKIDVTNGGEGALKRHAGLTPFEDKGKNHKLRTPVADSGNLLGHLKKPESEEVTNDSAKKKNHSAINNQPTQLSITAVLEKSNVISAEIRWCLEV